MSNPSALPGARRPAEEPEDVLLISAAELVARYRRRELSPVEVTEASLRRIARLEGRLRAFLTVTPDLARAQAADAERRYAEAYAAGGEAATRRLPPLLGVPVSVKDLAITKGVRTTFGCLAFKDNVPKVDAPLVRRLYEAGAVLLGKTNTSEFGYRSDTSNRLQPPCTNPWQAGKSAGGSSGGAAVAVSVGVSYLAHGTDGAGSIRIPAAMVGVVGFKPSRGLVPMFPAAGLLSHAGPLARSVRDAALMADVMAGYDPLDLSSIDLPAGVSLVGAVDAALADPDFLRGVRVGYLTDFLYLLSPGVAECVYRVHEALAARGCEIVEFSLQESLFAIDKSLVFPPWPVMVVLWQVQNGLIHPDIAAVADLIEPDRKNCFRDAEQHSAVTYGLSLQLREQYYHAMRAIMAEKRVSFLVSQTLCSTATYWEAGVAQPMSFYTGKLDFEPHRALALCNVTGQPACSIPIGFDKQGAPVGAQFVGALRADAAVLQIAAVIEATLPKFPSPPIVTAKL